MIQSLAKAPGLHLRLAFTVQTCMKVITFATVLFSKTESWAFRWLHDCVLDCWCRPLEQRNYRFMFMCLTPKWGLRTAKKLLEKRKELRLSAFIQFIQRNCRMFSIPKMPLGNNSIFYALIKLFRLETFCKKYRLKRLLPITRICRRKCACHLTACISIFFLVLQLHSKRYHAYFRWKICGIGKSRFVAAF